VRELRHAIERACAIAAGDVIEPGDLALRAPTGTVPPPGALPGTPAGGTLASQYAALDATERRLVEQAMAAAGGNVSEAARLLGITRIMMKRRIERFSGGSGDPGE
jgi:Nif-specific regulatory protein